MEAESTVADKCHGNNKKRNTVKNQILINKKSFALIKEGLLSTKKKFTYKEKKKFTYAKIRFVCIHKTNPRQIAAANSHGKYSPQIAAANFHGK